MLRSPSSSRPSLLAVLMPGLLAFVVILAEIQFHFVEYVLGAYLDSTNGERARLDRFVQQEIQAAQAAEKVQRLLEESQKKRRTIPSSRRTAEPPSDAVYMEREGRIMVSRARFLELYAPMEAEAPALKQEIERSGLANGETWTRVILSRPEGSRSGEVFLVDDRNYALHRTPLPAGLFERFSVSVLNATSPFKNDVERVYTPQRFFAMLRGLPEDIRYRIIASEQFSEMEASARRVGLSASREDGAAEIVIERVVNGQIALTPIPVSADLLYELNLALGEITPPGDQ